MLKVTLANLRLNTSSRQKSASSSRWKPNAIAAHVRSSHEKPLWRTQSLHFWHLDDDMTAEEALLLALQFLFAIKYVQYEPKQISWPDMFDCVTLAQGCKTGRTIKWQDVVFKWSITVYPFHYILCFSGEKATVTYTACPTREPTVISFPSYLHEGHQACELYLKLPWSRHLARPVHVAPIKETLCVIVIAFEGRLGSRLKLAVCHF